MGPQTIFDPATVQIPSPRNLPIDTIVVLMMENRSFDHYLGWLPGADGRQAGLTFGEVLDLSGDESRPPDLPPTSPIAARGAPGRGRT